MNVHWRVRRLFFPREYRNIKCIDNVYTLSEGHFKVEHFPNNGKDIVVRLFEENGLGRMKFYAGFDYGYTEDRNA